MTYREFLEWMAYLNIEPHGEGRADLRAGIIACTVAQASGAKRQFKPSEFMPKFGDDEQPKPMSAHEMQAAMNIAIAARKKR